MTLDVQGLILDQIYRAEELNREVGVYVSLDALEGLPTLVDDRIWLHPRDVKALIEQTEPLWRYSCAGEVPSSILTVFGRKVEYQGEWPAKPSV